MLDNTICTHYGEFADDPAADIEKIGGIDPLIEVMRDSKSIGRFAAAWHLRESVTRYPSRAADLKQAFAAGLKNDDNSVRRLSVEALAALSDEELAARIGVPVSVVPVLRGARDLAEARAYAAQVLEPLSVPVDAPETLGRFRELVERGLDGHAAVRELKAVGGDLKALRLALTGSERGPELAAVIDALPRDELLRRVLG